MVDNSDAATWLGSERPELIAAVPRLLETRWPRFMLEGRAGHDVDLTALVTSALDYQVLLVGGDDELVGAGIAVPLNWDGTVEGLPAGWDDAVIRSSATVGGSAAPAAVCALSVTVSQGIDTSAPSVILARLKQASAALGARWLIVPVRPVLKARYPLIPMARYLDWRTEDGLVFDPWLRRHLSDGARLLTCTAVSMTITGTVAEWQNWLGMALPGSGDFVIPGGLEPLRIDREADHGVYEEANVWVCYDL